MSQRILVLTSSTGSGHDMRAKAFSQWVRQFHGEDTVVHIEHIIENGSLLGKFGVWLYNSIHKHCPWLHNIYFFIVELFVFSHSRRVSFGGRYYRSLLGEFRPDLVFSVHDSTNRGYFEDARRVLGPKVRCVTYCGEFSGGYGYSRNWVNPSADLFIARTGRAREQAIQLGMPAERTVVFHKLLPPACFNGRIQPPEKASRLRQLGLEPDRFTLFLATGGYGANHHLAFLKALLPLSGRIQLIVICGRNQAVFDQINGWIQRNPSLKTYVEGYSNRVSDFLQIAHAIITRGGANTTMEALHFECPLIYNGLGGLMPQEMCTVRYFIEQGAARMIRSTRDLARVLENWSRFNPEYDQVRESLARLHVDEDPRELVRLVTGRDSSCPAMA
jgi:processive 1,2-diacylglycerol beta-glucosyltransferase